jgi:hypothetical protein
VPKLLVSLFLAIKNGSRLKIEKPEKLLYFLRVLLITFCRYLESIWKYFYRVSLNFCFPISIHLICSVDKNIFLIFWFWCPPYEKCPPGPKLEYSIVNILPFLKLGNFKIAVTPRAFVRFGWNFQVKYESLCSFD